MNNFVHEFIDFIILHRHINTKEEMIDITTSRFHLVKDGRALYRTDFFAVVFCYTKNGSFSNVVLSLSKLEKYDHIPCFVILVKRNAPNVCYMINSTFIDKISHSSKDLSTSNIRGSFLGSNIIKVIPETGFNNEPAHFDKLFAYHQGFSWFDNLQRIVEKTSGIKPIAMKASFNETELSCLLDSPKRAQRFINSPDFPTLFSDLQNRCNEVYDAILIASRIENVNIRGRLIEVLITADNNLRCKLLHEIGNIEHLLPQYDTSNDLGDYVRSFKDSDTYTDIKTKILYLNSNPKAYNIDKFLQCMASDKSVFMLFFIGIDDSGIVNTILCSVFHNKLINSTLLQSHWAGRATRGAAQFSGNAIKEMIAQPDFHNIIDIDKSIAFLNQLLNR